MRSESQGGNMFKIFSHLRGFMYFYFVCIGDAGNDEFSDPGDGNRNGMGYVNGEGSGYGTGYAFGDGECLSDGFGTDCGYFTDDGDC
jgi:hypothetical protein